MSWDYLQPVKILFGEGRIKELKEIAQKEGYRKGMLISDPFFAKNGLAQEIIRKSDGAVTDLFADISPNPDVTEVDACAEKIRREKNDFVIALGGGSSMDCAKAAACIALTQESVRKYHGTGIPVPSEHIPLIAVPTTAGTGSEVTCVSVLTDKNRGIKSPIISDSFYPDYAVIDPQLTYTMPSPVTASCGIDVLAHALEGFWSRRHQPICDACALHAAELVFCYLPRAYTCPADKEAREKMCEASLIAGLAFTLPKTTAPHACSFPLTNLYHIPHGEASGMTLDYFTEINAAGPEGRRIHNFAKKLGFRDAQDMAAAIRTLRKSLHLRMGLRNFSVSREKIGELIRGSKSPNLYNNPVPVTDEMLKDLYVRLTAL